MNNILIVFGMTLLVAICIAGSISSGVMAKPTKPSYWCVPVTDGYTVKCCEIFPDEDGGKKYCTVCADTNPPSNCTPREEVREDSNNQDTSIPPNSGVEDDTNSGENTSPRIPTKGGGISTLDDKVLSPSP
jgi:hypothetical protein